MKKELDFSKARRGAAVPQKGKTRITIYLDDEVLAAYGALSEKTGKGYQTLINDALRNGVDQSEQPLTTALVRKIVREDLALHE